MRKLAFLFALCFYGFAAVSYAGSLNVGLILDRDEWADFKKGKIDLADEIKLIEENGGKAVLFHVGEKDADIDGDFKGLHAVLVPGGDDIDPKYYNEKPSEKLETTNSDLDEFEFKIITKAFAKKIPMLGICRGSQILNVWRGGSLYQDVPSELGSAVVHRIKKRGESRPCFHEIVPEGALAGGKSVRVNSYHHQGVKKLGVRLKPLACARDGLIEAFESTDVPYIIGVQFHPEIEPAGEMRLFVKRFFDKLSR